jgi:hypothetical protein
MSYGRVMNPDTKTYNLIADLPVEYRKFDENKKYPIRQVLQIIRIKRVDGTEWLKSKGKLIGLDRAGNEVDHSFSDPEMYFKPIRRHGFKKKDPRNEYSPTERVCEEASITERIYFVGFITARKRTCPFATLSYA